MTSDSVTWLFGLERFGIKLGLDSITSILDALGNPHRSYSSVHIAGTNGKGSVTAMVEACLRAAGHRTGRYTSPHLVDITERIAVNGAPVPRHAFERTVGDVKAVIETLIRGGGLGTLPTFFETTTAVAFEMFRRAEVQVAVSEVGLGGRLDATNVLTPRVAAITSIAFDHERHLGSTLGAIAAEKAGILKPNVPVVLGPMPVEARSAIERIASDVGAPIVDAAAEVTIERAGRSPADEVESHAVRIRTRLRDYGELVPGLHGVHQLSNAAVAIRVLELLDAAGMRVSAQATSQGLATVRWAGRLERRTFPDGRELLLDAAHNPDGAAALAAFLRDRGSRRPLVFASMRDKDYRGMLRELLPVSSALVATRVANERAEHPEAIAAIARELLPDLPVSVELVPHQALAVAWERSSSIVVAGSLFLLGEILSKLEAS
jgi:dihydrofolate synthase/folylpolyglutamate synthase